MEKTVAVQKCDRYERNLLAEKLDKLFDLLGGLENFVKKGDKVLLKVNLLMGKPPEAAVTTHPLIVQILAEKIVKIGGKVIIADSPGGPFNKRILNRFYNKAGLKEIADESSGIFLNYNTDSKRVDFPQGKYSKYFEICNFANEADVIINLPKLKTHGMTMFTGAIKNIFGVIPGLLKSEYHFKMLYVAKFMEMLFDLEALIKPNLNIMDAVIGMEGEGPSGGQAKKFGYLMASNSAVSLDVAATYLMGIESLKKVPQNRIAQKRGLPSDIKDIKITGDKIERTKNVKIPDIPEKTNLIDRYLPGPLNWIFNYWLRPRPVVNQNKCVGCGICEKSCPAKTIEIKDNLAVIDLDDCIRCFCCQELCEYQAINIHRPLLGKMIFKF